MGSIGISSGNRDDPCVRVVRVEPATRDGLHVLISGDNDGFGLACRVDAHDIISLKVLPSLARPALVDVSTEFNEADGLAGCLTI